MKYNTLFWQREVHEHYPNLDTLPEDTVPLATTQWAYNAPCTGWPTGTKRRRPLDIGQNVPGPSLGPRHTDWHLDDHRREHQAPGHGPPYGPATSPLGHAYQPAILPAASSPVQTVTGRDGAGSHTRDRSRHRSETQDGRPDKSWNRSLTTTLAAQSAKDKPHRPKPRSTSQIKGNGPDAKRSEDLPPRQSQSMVVAAAGADTPRLNYTTLKRNRNTTKDENHGQHNKQPTQPTTFCCGPGVSPERN